MENQSEQNWLQEFGYGFEDADRPTAEEIADGCREAQSHWSPLERLARSRGLDIDEEVRERIARRNFSARLFTPGCFEGRSRIEKESDS